MYVSFAIIDLYYLLSKYKALATEKLLKTTYTFFKASILSLHKKMNERKKTLSQTLFFFLSICSWERTDTFLPLTQMDTCWCIRTCSLEWDSDSLSAPSEITAQSHLFVFLLFLCHENNATTAYFCISYYFGDAIWPRHVRDRFGEIQHTHDCLFVPVLF